MKTRIAVAVFLFFPFFSRAQDAYVSLYGGVDFLKMKGVAFVPKGNATITSISPKDEFPLAGSAGFRLGFVLKKFQLGVGISDSWRYFEKDVCMSWDVQGHFGNYTSSGCDLYRGRYHYASIALSANYPLYETELISAGPSAEFAFSHFYFLNAFGPRRGVDADNPNFSSISAGAFLALRIKSFSIGLAGYAQAVPWQENSLFANDKIGFSAQVAVSHFFPRSEL